LRAAAASGHSRAGAHLWRPQCAKLKRIASEVIAVQFNEVKGVEEYALVSAVVTDEIERGNAVVIAGDSFAIRESASTIGGKRRVSSLPGWL